MSAQSAVVCPHCAKQYTMTPEFLAKRGGQTIACKKCGGVIEIPAANAASAEAGASVLDYAGPRRPRTSRVVPPAVSEATFVCPFCQHLYSLDRQYVSQYHGQEIACEKCSMPVAVPDTFDPISPDEEDPDATLTPDDRPARVWREKSVVAMDIGARLPDCCAKCGEAETVPHTQLTLTWNPKSVSVGNAIATGAMGGAATGVTKVLLSQAAGTKATIEVGFCRSHRNRRQTLFGLTIVLSVLSVVAMVWGVALAVHYGLLLTGVLLFFVAVVTGLSAQFAVEAGYIDTRVVKLLNLHPELVKRVPLRRLERQAVQSADTAAFDQIQ